MLNQTKKNSNVDVSESLMTFRASLDAMVASATTYLVGQRPVFNYHIGLHNWQFTLKNNRIESIGNQIWQRRLQQIQVAPKFFIRDLEKLPRFENQSGQRPKLQQRYMWMHQGILNYQFNLGQVLEIKWQELTVTDISKSFEMLMNCGSCAFYICGVVWSLKPTLSLAKAFTTCRLSVYFVCSSPTAYGKHSLIIHPDHFLLPETLIHIGTAILTSSGATLLWHFLQTLQNFRFSLGIGIISVSYFLNDHLVVRYLSFHAHQGISICVVISAMLIYVFQWRNQHFHTPYRVALIWSPFHFDFLFSWAVQFYVRPNILGRDKV